MSNIFTRDQYFQTIIFAIIELQTHLLSKIMHQNFVLILRQFNYSKNSFIALVLLVHVRIQTKDI